MSKKKKLDSLRVIRELQIGNTVLSADAIAELNTLNGLTKTAAQINTLVEGLESGYRIARGQRLTTNASGAVATGLNTVLIAVATLDDDPVAGCQFATASVGNQIGAPAAGAIYIKTWKHTGPADTAIVPATTFSKQVNWIAFGT